MTPKAEKLLPKIEKAGVRATLKLGHTLTVEELLDVKVQIMPAGFRWLLGGISAATAFGSYLAFQADQHTLGGSLVIASLLSFFFAVAGIRRTFRTLMDAQDAAELLAAALEGIGSITGSLFDASS